MQKAIKIILSIVLLVFAFVPTNAVQAASITVCASGCDYTTIQAAINAASAGDEIQIGAGTYNENVVVDKNDLTLVGALALNPNDVASPATHTIIDSGAPASTSLPGITINSGVTGVTIRNLRVQNFSSHSGIYGVLSNDGLTIENVHVYSNNTTNSVNGGGIYMNGPVSNVLINNVDSQSNRSRGIVIWNGFKQNITITNSYVANNNCCGIELQDGTASGVTMSNNTVINNTDSGMAAVGLMSGAGPNVISNNTLTNNGRFGIEIKLPNGTGATSGDGSIVVENNTVTLSTPSADLRDFAGIAVFRRGWVSGNNNVDIPTGVVVRNNTVTGYVQNNVGSNSTGFGIVVEGTKMQVLNNTVNGNEVGIQVQAGHLPYTANTNIDGDQSNLSDSYFGRGNSPIACAKVDANIYSSNGVDDATVGSAASRTQTIFNQTKNTYHCTIQEAIDLANSGDTIQVPAGTYTENLTIDKGLTLLGPNSAINPNTGSRVAEAIIQPATSNPDPDTSCSIIAYLSTSNITIKGFTFDGDNPSLTSNIMIGSADVDACELLAGYEGMGNIVVENNILRHSTYTGIDFYNYYNNTATAGNYIRYNLFENMGETTYNWGIGILVYNNFYADISDNVLNNVRVGIQTGNFSQANPGSTGVINNNQINAWRLGIFHNLWYSSASDMPVTNNTITAVSSTGSTKWNGMLISSFQTTVDTTITNNTINIGSITQNPASGYNMWNITTSAPITISGGTVTGGNYGVWVNNFEGYNNNATATTAYVDGVTITNAIDAGVYVLDSPSNTNNATVQAVITNTTISNSGKGVHVANADATAEVRNSTIANSTTEGIYNNGSTLTVNSTTVSASGTNNLNNLAGSVSISNTILANATSMDCTSSNPLVLNSFNLIETNSGCGTPALTSDPLLGSLANNGGSTQTMALSATSPAINAGDNGTCEATDQRGIARPQHTTCDIGAYEYSDTTAPTVSSIVRASTSPTSAASVDFTVTFSESVAGVDVADFSLTTTGVSGASITSVSGSNSSYTVSVNTGSGNGTIRLDVPNSATITDAFSNALSGLPFTGGETYVVVKSPTFADVPETHWAYSWIERLYAAGLTGGCTTSPLNYCPTLPVTRAEMAVFLEKGLRGNSFTPPNVPATFGDTAGHWAEDWIEALKADGITGGCGDGNYCPNAPVTRAEMAVFLLRVIHIASYTPPNHAPTFADSAGHWAEDWIEQLALEGITSGCGGGNYCPNSPATRDQMAVFLVKAFGLP